MEDFVDEGLPEGATYVGGICVAQYIDVDGHMKFFYRHNMENATVSSSIGLLEMAKLDIWKRSLEEDRQ